MNIGDTVKFRAGCGIIREGKIIAFRNEHTVQIEGFGFIATDDIVVE